MNLPPVHPILVNFTAALVPASVLSDFLGRVLKKGSLTSAAWWMLVYASVVTPLTVIAGWYWLRQMADMDHPQMAIHKWLGTALAIVFFALLLWRWRIQRAGAAAGWRYLACAALVVAALTVQGHLGGTMSFASDDAAASQTNTPASPETGHGGHDHHAASDSGATSAPANDIQWKDHIDLKG